MSLQNQHLMNDKLFVVYSRFIENIVWYQNLLGFFPFKA